MSESDVREMRAKLTHALKMLDAAHAAKTAADHLSERAREMGGGIPGFGGSGSQRAAAQVRGAYGSADRAHAAADERIALWTGKIASLERRIAEKERVRLTRDDLVGATHIRVGRSWRKVSKLNVKSVSVETGYSWTDRIAFDQVLEARTIHAEVKP